MLHPQITRWMEAGLQIPYIHQECSWTNPLAIKTLKGLVWGCSNRKRPPKLYHFGMVLSWFEVIPWWPWGAEQMCLSGQALLQWPDVATKYILWACPTAASVYLFFSFSH